MKVDYEKYLLHLKIAMNGLFQKNPEISRKIKNIVYELDQIKKENKKKEKDKKIKNNINFISKQPEKSIKIIEKLIEQETKNIKENLDE